MLASWLVGTVQIAGYKNGKLICSPWLTLFFPAAQLVVGVFSPFQRDVLELAGVIQSPAVFVIVILLAVVRCDPNLGGLGLGSCGRGGQWFDHPAKRK